MRICIDLDGVICETKRPNQEYKDVMPIEGIVKKLQELKQSGHYIIIHTARHMKTCNNNLGQIIAIQGPVVIEWLKRYDIPYDELLFGKPRADVYIDDKALKFTNWKDINL